MIKTLFVSSGSHKNGVKPIVLNQGESLKKAGITLEYFVIKGSGLMAYLKAIPNLRKMLRDFDIIHAHYSLSGLVAFLAGAKPLVVSLMGSDVNSKNYLKFLTYFSSRFLWSRIIVKSEDMRKNLQKTKTEVIPNGVDFKRFYPIKKNEALIKTLWNPSKKHILFASNPNRPEKNYNLAKRAFGLLNTDDLELHYLNNVPNEKMPFYLCSADVLLLTSFWEGSPNIVKEAMACNIPIVSTNVGDVSEIISNTDGCYITSFLPEDAANSIKSALNFGRRTTGRKNVKHLEISLIALKIIKVYSSILERK